MQTVRYVIISPVKDEGRFIERTLESVRRQTIQPYLWIIVDDGSTDETPRILARYARQLDWIKVVSLAANGRRLPGSGVIRAFLAGYEHVAGLDFDFVVKLDCDLEFDPEYFEGLLQEFVTDPSLGVASGVYAEEFNGEWREIKMPRYHAAGASKVVRRACFDDIRAFVPSRGWDTVDEIRAQMAGWKTAHFPHLKLRHLKPEGSGIGILRTSVMSGEIYYLTGGGAIFFAMKFLHRLVVGRPVLIGALAMLVGYGRPWLRRRPRLVNRDEARFYRALLNRRIIAAVRRARVSSLPQEASSST
jgi:glycosyltransferase involved in cell wall biosynthesis